MADSGAAILRSCSKALNTAIVIPASYIEEVRWSRTGMIRWKPVCNAVTTSTASSSSIRPPTAQTPAGPPLTAPKITNKISVSEPSASGAKAPAKAEAEEVDDRLVDIDEDVEIGLNSDAARLRSEVQA